MTTMESDSQNSWRFAQCFGDKGEVEDITEGECISRTPNEIDNVGNVRVNTGCVDLFIPFVVVAIFTPLDLAADMPRSRYNLDCRV